MSLRKELVSIIIPVYNRPLELKRAIQSVLNQTYQNFEILVVDDGSEEDLKLVCDSFNDKRILFFRNEKHINANVARNRGIQEAKGEYIAMLDSDDEFLPLHLERRLQKIKEWNCDGIFGSAVITLKDETRLVLSRQPLLGEQMIDYLLGSGSATTPSHFYKSECAKKVLWDELLYRHQDFDFTVRFAASYSFMSDYEPTVLINWQNSTGKLIDLDSCVYFISKHLDYIKPRIFNSYAMQQIEIAKKQKDEKILNFFKNELIKRVNHLSIVDWFTIYEPKNNVQKFSSLLMYFITLTKVLIAQK
ncbi:glycosyltransferase family 2 protein [Carboxylicivirga mesophila]|uniref:Glycosyltransferase family 2 protein n=1 Tax=Carboxylicivirga mesophila TaxID=1166478 RepID=A0ABS5KAS4_9BACT|nr:glycosyltransferase family 2 protein [Carboxylicivirga mesophila]MBS2212128.1 glycosyltransferase family 2 protein [Carboxylicivirga mesophila]